MVEHPKLALHLLRLFAKGELSGAQVQGLAHAAMDDGWGHGNELAEKLAKAGTDGTWSGHVVRDIMIAVRKAGLMASTAQPYKMKLANGSGEVSLFLPHEVFKKITDPTDLSG